MKKLFIILFVTVVTQIKATPIVNITNDTTINGAWDLNGSILRISAKISGNCTISNAFIEASPFIKIFDTSVVIGAGCKIREFSVMWYGAVNGSTDSYYAIQKSIDQCKDRFNLYFPRNIYTTTQSLLIANYNSSTGKYGQTSIRMHGDAAMWDDDSGTKIVYTGNSYAIGLQVNKGSEISNLVIEGGWQSPGGTDTVYFNITEANYVNGATNGNGQGIVIDPYFDGTNSGSTGCKFHDLYVKNFNTLFLISNSAGTQNGEIMSFKDIQLGNAKYGFYSSQPQEKMNVIDGVHSWGAIYCIFKLKSGGNYYISKCNVAGWCVQMFDIDQASWFPVFISNIYAEHFARIGKINSYVPISVNNCLFDFAYPSQAGNQTLLITNSSSIKFNSCTFRYYGQSTNLIFSSPSTYENCLFSGAVGGGSYINYSSGFMNISGAKILTIIDSVISSNPVKMKLRPSYKN